MMMHENEGVMRMIGYRVCLDCDRRIEASGDEMHEIRDGVLIGCERYVHKGDEGRVIEVHGITVDKVMRVASQIQSDWNRDCQGKASEDYSDAFSYIGELLQYTAAEMLYQIYKDDGDHRIVLQMQDKLFEAEIVAEIAVAGLVPFGINTEDWK
jgi:hypothetical protein